MLLCPWNSGEYWESWSGLWFPSPGELSLPRDRAWVSHIAGRRFPIWATSSVQFSRSVMSDSLWPHESQHARPPCPSPTPRVHSDSHPSSQWCHPAISSSVIPFSSCPQSLPASKEWSPQILAGHMSTQNENHFAVFFIASFGYIISQMIHGPTKT